MLQSCRYVRNAFSVLLMFLLVVPSFLAQEDSTMQIKRFTFDDLHSEKFEKYKKSSSTNRLAENPEDLTQEVIIVDGDEIRKFGYSTLVDVLKTIPGFRTSQPGNAIEGETFLMRGLLGNDHTKILINGIPIKPEAVKSMPIAAQLPIRHAEYIEIVQGPASATYGSDAMAGVINIVFPEVDRPVFAWADVSGMTPATTEINLTLGGKAGSGKNILNYQFFASSQRASTVNLLINRDSITFDPANLNQWEAQWYLPDKDTPELPEINELRRESRLMGAYLKFRWFELYAMDMYREEHSAFGSSPLAVSYSDPSTIMGENIRTIGLKHVYDNKKRYSSRAALSLLSYETIGNSNYLAIRDSLSAGRNYIYARSLDLRAEYQGILKFNDRFKMAFGTTGQYSISNPYTSYLGRRLHLESNSYSLTGPDLFPETSAGLVPASDSVSAIDSVNWIPKYEVLNVAGFVHFLYKSKNGKLNLEAASRIDVNTTDGIRFTPSLGAVYRPGKKLRLVANYGWGHRAPRSYHLYNNYWQNANEIIQPPPGGIDFDDIRLRRSLDTLRTELLQGGELRIVWDVSPSWRFSGRYYFHFMENRLTRQVSITPPVPPTGGQPFPDNLPIGTGYYNNRVSGSYSYLNALMVIVEYQKSWRDFALRFMGSYEFAGGYEEIEGEENVPESVVRSVEYRFVPTHMVKANINMTYKGFTLSLHNNIFGWFVSDIYVLNNAVVYGEFDGLNYNTDILLHKDLFRQLSLFVGAYNILNTFQSGIPASSLSNTWGYNPQYGRVFKLGLNFRLN